MFIINTRNIQYPSVLILCYIYKAVFNYNYFSFPQALMVVIAEGVLGIDVYQFGIGVFLFFIGSAVIGFIIAFLILLFPDKKYQKAVSFLNEIKNFENE